MDWIYLGLLWSNRVEGQLRHMLHCLLAWLVAEFPTDVENMGGWTPPIGGPLQNLIGGEIESTHGRNMGGLKGTPM